MRAIGRGACVFVVACVLAGAGTSSAAAAGFPFELDPVLSLRGDCGTSVTDPIADPSCPYTPPPAGPIGRFIDPRAIAVDQWGNVYVASYGNGPEGRIDVFDDEGHFITELLDPHGPKSIAVDSKGNIYAYEFITNGEVVRYSPTVYEPETGNIAYGGSRALLFEREGGALGGVAVDASNDHLFATFAGSFIQEYASADDGNGLLTIIEMPKVNWINWAAIDAQRRRLYTSFCKNGLEDCGVLVLDADAPYELIEEIDGSNLPAGAFHSLKGWIGLAVNEESGHLFAADLEQTKNVYEFDEEFGYLATTATSSFQGGNSLQIAVSNSTLNPSAKNKNYLFVPIPVNAGSALAFHPPAEQEPDVKDLEALNISETGAELRATIEPNGGVTEYVLEYVSQDEFDQAGWAAAHTAAVGTIPQGDPTRTVVVSVNGLKPGVGYRVRGFASNGAGDDEEEGTFSTYADAPAGPAACPNAILRIGLSSSLPDCRAYELVTPPDTNGRPPKGVGALEGYGAFPAPEASASGSAVSFLTEGGSLPGTGGTGGFSGDPYRASRGQMGWTTMPTGPSGDEASVLVPGSTSPDQGYSFWTGRGEGTAVVDGLETRYVRYPDGHSEFVGRGSLASTPYAEGILITEGGGHIIFSTDNVASEIVPKQLEQNAPPDGTVALYDRTSDGVTHVVSLLPEGGTPAPGNDAVYRDSSPDGSGIAFSIDSKLYLRVDNSATYEIGDGVTLADVSEGGSRAFYLEGGDLFALDVESEEVIRFTETGDATVVNVAPDGSRAYFVSSTAIAGSGMNPNEAVAQSGQPNLYLSEEGSIRFVATVIDLDVEGETSTKGGKVNGLGLWTQFQADQPAKDPSRVSSNGAVLLFQSRADLDGQSPGSFPQLFRYDSVGNRLQCISCNPTNTPESGGSSLQTFAFGEDSRQPLGTMDFVPNLTPDGDRAFFESAEPLVSRDSDAVIDVYEWEAEGAGSCAKPGGCAYLISSGQSARENFLYSVSSSGDDVFFVTEDVLVDGDDDTSSIYDARVGGGFPMEPEGRCMGEECRLPLAPAPFLPNPTTNQDPGNDTRPKPRRCAKSKRKIKRQGKVRCVKKHAGKSRHRKGAAAGGAGR